MRRRGQRHSTRVVPKQTAQGQRVLRTRRPEVHVPRLRGHGRRLTQVPL